MIIGFLILQNLRVQKRLAAAVLKCGKKRVTLTPGQEERLSKASSRQAIRKLVKLNLITKKPVKGQSRERCRKYAEAKRAGRHAGIGKRHGTKNARMPFKVLWMRRIRVLRRLLRKYREQKKIDRKTYHNFYLRCKGNQYKNKRVLIEAIWNAKNEQNKQKALADQRDIKKAKAAAKKERKEASAAEKLNKKASALAAAPAAALATTKP